MPTKELRELRHKFKAAYTDYMHSVHALSDASQKGESPTEDVLRLEQEAFTELTILRHGLLEALRQHGMKSRS